ncbi:hypothetical protein ACOSQ3_008724 [Xanthoceras sorbifolium]
MGRSPCSMSKKELNRGAWTALEDKILKDYIENNDAGRWNKIPKQTGLKRSGKSCRLRWMNYLRPDIVRGNISPDEEDLIIRLHKLLGNRWSLIAGRLPGRTDNEIKNYWNTVLSKKVEANREDPMIIKELPNDDDDSVDPPVPSSLLDENVLIEPSINNGVFEAAEWGFSDELLPIIACGDDSLRDLMIDVNESWQIISLSEALQTDEVDKLCDRNATMIDNEESFYVRNWNSEDSFHQFESDLDLW